jgi:hypothetical protein
MCTTFSIKINNDIKIPARMVPTNPRVKVAPFCPHHQSENVSIVYNTKDVSMHNSQQTCI